MEDNDDFEQQQRWWPSNRQRMRPSPWAEQLIAEILGPVLNHELPSVIEDAERMGLKISDELRQLVRSLQEADGRGLRMLPLLAGAVALSYDFCSSGAKLSEGAPGYTRHAYSQWADIYKLLGDVAYVAAQMYGFNDLTWSIYVGADDSEGGGHYSGYRWPPQGIEYRTYF